MVQSVKNRQLAPLGDRFRSINEESIIGHHQQTTLGDESLVGILGNNDSQ